MPRTPEQAVSLIRATEVGSVVTDATKMHFGVGDKSDGEAMQQIDADGFVAIIRAIFDGILEVIDVCPESSTRAIAGYRKRSWVAERRMVIRSRRNLPKAVKSKYWNDVDNIVAITLDLMDAKDDSQLGTVLQDTNDPGNDPF